MLAIFQCHREFFSQKYSWWIHIDACMENITTTTTKAAFLSQAR